MFWTLKDGPIATMANDFEGRILIFKKKNDLKISQIIIRDEVQKYRQKCSKNEVLDIKKISEHSTLTEKKYCIFDKK